MQDAAAFNKLMPVIYVNLKIIASNRLKEEIQN